MYDVWCMMYGTWLVYTPPKFTPQKFKKDGWKTTFPFRKVTFLGLQVGIIFTYGQWDMKYDKRAKQNWRYFIDKPRTTSQIIFCDILNHVPLATQQRLCFSVLMSFDEGTIWARQWIAEIGMACKGVFNECLCSRVWRVWHAGYMFCRPSFGAQERHLLAGSWLSNSHRSISWSKAAIGFQAAWQDMKYHSALIGTWVIQVKRHIGGFMYMWCQRCANRSYVQA